MRFLPLAALMALLCFFAPAQSQSSPPDPSRMRAPEPVSEMRGLWVVRDGLNSPQEIRQVVAVAVKYHFNALFVQVRGRGDAWYRSPYEPRAESLAQASPDFDPLECMVEEAHRHGLQVHAWLNTFLTWSGSRRPASPKHLWNARRDWFVADRNGRVSSLPTDQCEGAFLQPGHPAVQEHLFNVFTHVAANYDVDGIHFDFVRYPNENYDFSAGALARFRAAQIERIGPEKAKRFDARLPQDRLAYVHAFRAEWNAWRRAQITGLVERISRAVKMDKPWMIVSAAVFANVEDAAQAKGQDWGHWLKNGLIDAVALMSYGADTEKVVHQTRHAVAVAGERHVYAGIGAWRLQAHDVARKIERVRSTGAAGINLFSYNSIRTRPNYLQTLARGVFASRSLPPRMRWLPDRSATASPSAEEKREP